MKKIYRSKKAITLTLVIVIIAGIWYEIGRHRHSSSFKQDPVVVETAKAKQGEITIEAHAVGSLTAAQNVQITAEVAGQVEKILFHDGSFVKAGTPLIQLDDAVNKVKAESAKANLNYSSANYNRMVFLGKKGAISQQAIDQAHADLKEKKAIAEEKRVIAEKMLILAPFDGVLGKSKVNLGEYVNNGNQIVTLTDTKNLRVEYSISEKYFSFIKQGQQVTLTTSAYPGKLFYGKVAYVSPTINTEDRTISLYADVPNQDGLLTAGLFMNVTHLLGDEKNVLLIPAVSLVATIDGQQVYKIVNNKAVAVPVKIGQRTMDKVQIMQGLVANDIVIIAGQHKVKDGSDIKVKS